MCYNVIKIKKGIDTMNLNISGTVREMSDDELTLARCQLENALATLNQENDRRRELRKAEAWRNVVRAINDYTAEFGAIQVETSTCWWALTGYETVGYFEAYD
jgi:hypothetical protein